MTEIVWNKNIEEQNKLEIEKYLVPFLWLVPGWCQTLYIALYPSSETGESVVETTTNYDYRNIKIDFFSCWLNEREDAKAMHVVHELLHGFVAVLADYAGNSFDTLCPEETDEKFNKHLYAELKQRHEAVVQDLAFAILNKFNERT